MLTLTDVINEIADEELSVRNSCTDVELLRYHNKDSLKNLSSDFLGLIVYNVKFNFEKNRFDVFV